MTFNGRAMNNSAAHNHFDRQIVLDNSKVEYACKRRLDHSDESVVAMFYTIIVDGMTIFDSHNYVCRYGINADVMPACPITACRDAMCLECDDESEW